MSRTLLFLVALGLVVTMSNVQADDKDGKSANFNPFSEDESLVDTPPAKSSTRSTARIDQKEPAEGGGFAWPSYLKPKLPSLPKPSMPKLSMPSWASTSSKTKSRGKEEPSTWTKINTGTKNLVTSTKNTLMPWTVDEKTSSSKSSSTRTASSNRQRISSSSSKSASRSKPKTEKKSILESWFPPKEDEKPIETVNDYLSLPRIQY